MDADCGMHYGKQKIVRDFVILVGKFEGNFPFLLIRALIKQDGTLI
jgi:hypothetical protein